jgi:hypothetical protein
MLGTRKIGGLLERLGFTFWPDYSFSKATFNKQKGDLTEYKRRHRSKTELAAKKKDRGASLGIKVDKEISATVDMYKKKQNMSMQSFFNKSELHKDTSLTVSEKATITGLKKQTAMFWCYCFEQKLVPFQSQYILHYNLQHPLDAVAHPADVLCVDSKQHIWIIEVKTGYDGYLTNCTKHRMRQPFENKTDCKLHQHQIQVAAQEYMLKNNQPTWTIGGALVLHLPSEAAKATPYMLEDWARVPHFLSLLSAEQKQTAPTISTPSETKDESSASDEGSDEEDTSTKRQKLG